MEGYHTGLIPLHRPNRLKTRTALKTEMNGHEKLVLSNHPPKSAPAHLVAGRQVFLIFSAVFAIFSRSNVSKRVLKDNKYVLTCWETCISPSKCPERGGTFRCMEADRGPSDRGTPPSQAKPVENQSDPQNRNERARKVGFVKPPSKISSGLPSCRQTGFCDIFSCF